MSMPNAPCVKSTGSMLAQNAYTKITLNHSQLSIQHGKVAYVIEAIKLHIIFPYMVLIQ